MISEMCSISTSPEDVTETAASSDRMVKIEIEAAEALANLSQPVNTPHFAGKPKRGKRQVKCESPPSPAASYSAPSCSDLAQDPAVLFQQQDEWNLPNIAKAEADDQLINQSHICADYLSLGGGKSSQNLSEAEKEAKRLRRVLANRESARRTIRRRQALCEELARKAAELTNENEKLKKGKESALREYELLESRNKNLKAKVEKVVKLEGERIRIIKKAKAAKAADVVEHINVLKPSQTEMLTTSPANNLPVLLHNAPVTPFMWPTLFQSSNAGPSVIHASHTIQASCNPGDPCNIGPPVYILPFPLFMGHCETSCCHENKMELEPLEMLACSSSRRIAPACGLSSEVRFANDLNEVPVASPPLEEDDDGGSELHLSLISGKEDDGVSSVVVPSSGKDDVGVSSVVVPSSGKEDVGVSSVVVPSSGKEDVGVSSVVVPSSGKEDVVISEQHQGSSFLTLNGKKKLVDGTAAAEARRRRKELKKLKAVHGGQCRRMRC